jgi:hypothetical protein
MMHRKREGKREREGGREVKIEMYSEKINMYWEKEKRSI